MTITTVTRREANQTVACARMAAKPDPVFIMDRGKPVHVLPRIEDYRLLAGEARVFWTTYIRLSTTAIRTNTTMTPVQSIVR